MRLSFSRVSQYDANFGLGYGLNYASVTGINITVYVFDLGLDNIPDGIDSKAIADELMDASQEITASGLYTRIVEHPDATPLSPHFAQSFYTLTTNDGQVHNSYTLLRGHNGFFIKMRVSGPEGPIEHRVGPFLESLVKDLRIEEVSSVNE